MPASPSSSRHVVGTLTLALLIGVVALSGGRLAAQIPGVPEIPPRVRVTDGRLASALRQLVAASPSAARVMEALRASGLEVAVGTPAELAALPDSDGGPAPSERSALLSDPSTAPTPDEPPIAWVVFRVSAPPADAPAGDIGTVDRAWISVEADSVESWIRSTTDVDADRLIQHDYLAILAHELVAHVGSIARTRRLADFCDDPPPSESMDPRAQSCSLRVENQVRKELNRSLGLKGSDKFPMRKNYSLEVMNFARAHAMQWGRSPRPRSPGGYPQS
ncbi:MAG: hypothetical protein LJF04_12525 [Gemmatimonadetes bacterium]|nr:hypothetical protein [Gemmatimonadota bacterium]